MSDSMLGVLSELTSSDESSRAALRQSLERLDILVCGKCSKVFHSVHDFSLHRSVSGCEALATVSDTDLSESALAAVLWSSSVENFSEALSWSQLSQREQAGWLVAARTVRILRETGKMVFGKSGKEFSDSFRENTAAKFSDKVISGELSAVIPRSSRTIGKKFRGPGGKFVSVRPTSDRGPSTAKRMTAGVIPEPEFDPETGGRTKRKSSIRALDLVKQWSRDKASALTEDKLSKDSIARDKSSKTKQGRSDAIKTIVLGQSGGPATLAEAARIIRFDASTTTEKSDASSASRMPRHRGHVSASSVGLDAGLVQGCVGDRTSASEAVSQNEASVSDPFVPYRPPTSQALTTASPCTPSVSSAPNHHRFAPAGRDDLAALANFNRRGSEQVFLAFGAGQLVLTELPESQTTDLLMSNH